MTVDVVEEEVVEHHGSPAAVVAILLALAGLGLGGFSLYQLHDMRQVNQDQVAVFQAQQASLNNQVTLALTHLDQANTSIVQATQLGGQTLLSSLQILLLQGQSKTLLEANVNALQAELTRLNNPHVLSLGNDLKNQIGALPNINLADALTRLNQVSQNFANLSFVPAVAVQAKVTIPETIQGFWARLWYSIRGLIVVRTDNQIGTTLVTDASRFDALRTLNLQVQEVEWQLIHNQDPTIALTQLKTTLTTLTAADPNQAACLAQIDALIVSHDFYDAADVSAILTNIAALQSMI